MNHHDLTFTRGYIMDEFIKIELMINVFISQYFLGKVDTDFVLNVLNNEMSSFGFKKTILKQILDEKNYQKKFEDLEKLNRIRNLFGHGSLDLKTGEFNAQDAEWYLINPKKADDAIDPDTSKKEFDTLLVSVNAWLISVSKNKGIPYP